MKYYIVLLTFIIFLVIGCTNNTKDISQSSGSSDSTLVNYTERMAYPEGLPEGKPISIWETIEFLQDTLKPIEIQRFDCDTIDFINGRAYYIVREYEDYDDRQVTIGWYAVDAFTGETFDTNVLTDLVKISVDSDVD
ncbi:MAG: hypothetical protein FWG53_06795 [Clostridiales bacterium]|nr:hypothetical protein [Clostridiales bacterium]